MKHFLKKIAPSALLDFYSKKKYKIDQSPFIGKNVDVVFTEIYQTNKWGNSESVSGIGSTIENTTKIVSELNKTFIQLNIKTLLDIPCGDFNWAQNLNLNNINYLGADIVKELIETNKEKHHQSNIHFEVINIIEDPLPKTDLILVRDCFVHFSYDNILKSMQNIIASNSTYLLVTNFTKHRLNYNITTGDWRPINLEQAPFNFPEPEMVIEEHIDPTYKKEGKGKSLSLWKINNLKHLLNDQF